ncbi:hypothetical protein M758_UG180300 [Ceratodon purpureus]|nr:hypothetical protein M758_UG180300 [Ceratodon purpureus]
MIPAICLPFFAIAIHFAASCLASRSSPHPALLVVGTHCVATKELREEKRALLPVSSQHQSI